MNNFRATTSCQHYVLREYKNTNGDHILGGLANGSVSFQITQVHVGPGEFIDATFSSITEFQ
jgi:hypothetical protein